MKKKTILIHGAPDAQFLDQLRRQDRIMVTECRPSLRSSLAVCREVLKKGKTPIIICDNMAGFLFQQEMVHEVRMAYYRREGQQVLCDIGALILAVLCDSHRVALDCYPGRPFPALLGQPQDLFMFQGHRVAAAGVSAYIPLVEWVPVKYVRNIYE